MEEQQERASVFDAALVTFYSPEHRARYPSNVAIVEGFWRGEPVEVPCDWRSAIEIAQAIDDAGGKPVECSAPLYVLLWGRLRKDHRA